MNSKLIDYLYKIVEDACKSPNNKFGYGIWSHHIVYVIYYAKLLAEKTNADIEVVEIAALLHDYSGIRDSKLRDTHHINSAQDAEIILSKFNYPVEKIKAVKEAILSHRGSIKREAKSNEAKCLVNADAIAHIKHVISLLYYVFHEENMNIEDGKKWVSDKLERSWNKLDNDGRGMIASEYKVIKSLLE